MIDDHETCVMYKERLFNRDGHTFRLMACKDHGATWISELQIKTPFEAHLHAMRLMNIPRDLDDMCGMVSAEIPRDDLIYIIRCLIEEVA